MFISFYGKFFKKSKFKFKTYVVFCFSDTQLQPETKSEPLQSTPLGWGEYLGLYAPTVTLKQTKLVTTMVPDPRVVLTYSVKGCKPEKFPNDLERYFPLLTVTIITETSHNKDNFK